MLFDSLGRVSLDYNIESIQVRALKPTTHIFHSKQQMLIITSRSLKFSSIPVNRILHLFQ